MASLRSIRSIVVLGLVLVGALGAFFASNALAAAGTLTVSSETAAIGASSSFDVSADVEAPGLGAWTIDITYDPSVITITDCEGDNGSVCNAEYAANQIRVTGAAATGLEGLSILASVEFDCEVEGTSPLTVTLTGFHDATIGDPQPIDPATVNDGSVECAEEAATPTPGPEPSCEDDPFEPNDTDATPSEVSLPLNETGLVACPENLDYYAFDLTEGQEVTASAFFTHADGDIDIALIPEDYSTIASSEGTEDNESVTHVAETSGTYLLAVLLVDGPPEGNTYDLEISADGAAPTPGAVSGVPSAGQGSPTAPGGGSSMNWLAAGIIGAGLAWIFAGGVVFATSAAGRVRLGSLRLPGINTPDGPVWRRISDGFTANRLPSRPPFWPEDERHSRRD
jgi:hypothetical protein